MELFKGMKFSSYAEFKIFLDAYSSSNYVQFWKREARSLKQCERSIKRAAIADRKLVYYCVKLCCIFGGRKHIKRRKPNAKHERQSRTYRQGCTAYFKLLLSADAKFLEIVEEKMEHNHTISKEIFENIHHRRRLSPEAIENIRKYMQLNIGRKSLREAITRETGKKLTRWDLNNILSKFKTTPTSTNKNSSQRSSTANAIVSTISSLQISNEVEIASNEADSENSFDSTTKNNTMEIDGALFEKDDDDPQVSVTVQPIIVKFPMTPAHSFQTHLLPSYEQVILSGEHHEVPFANRYCSLKPYSKATHTQKPVPAHSEKIHVLQTQLPVQENIEQFSLTCDSKTTPSGKVLVPQIYQPELENTKQASVTHGSQLLTNHSVASNIENASSICKHDDYDSYGQYLASEIRSVEDTKQCDILKVKLQLLIYKAHQGLLTLND